jgi:hypothetical protein
MVNTGQTLRKGNLSKPLGIVFGPREGGPDEPNSRENGQTLIAVPLLDGKMRVTSQSWDDPLVICRLPSSSCAASTVA